MPSHSLKKWRNERLPALDQLQIAHRKVGGSGRGRRYAIEQINHAFAVLLSSQFQGFCRDLHSECADYFVQTISGNLRPVVRNAFVENRKLDKGNPNPGNIGADFNRFGLPFWDEVMSLDNRNHGRRNRLEELNRWRNAIAHQDFNVATLGTAVLRIHRVREWKNACGQLARCFDEAIRSHLQVVNGGSPW